MTEGAQSRLSGFTQRLSDVTSGRSEPWDALHLIGLDRLWIALPLALIVLRDIDIKVTSKVTPMTSAK